MKKIVVMARGRQEEEMGRELLAGIYGVIQGYGCTDVSVSAQTLADSAGAGIRIPEFLYQHGNQGEEGQYGRKHTTAGHPEGMGHCKEPGAEAHG